jgi:hypothetical protein
MGLPLPGVASNTSIYLDRNAMSSKQNPPQLHFLGFHCDFKPSLASKPRRRSRHPLIFADCAFYAVCLDSAGAGGCAKPPTHPYGRTRCQGNTSGLSPRVALKSPRGRDSPRRGSVPHAKGSGRRSSYSALTAAYGRMSPELGSVLSSQFRTWSVTARSRSSPTRSR